MRLLRTLGWLLLLIILIAIGLAGWLLGTESGLRFAVGQLESRGMLDARSIQGRALDRVTLERATLHLPELEVSAEQLELDWRPSALLHGQIHVLDLTGSGIRITPLDGAPEQPKAAAAPFEGLVLPLSVRVDHLRVERLDIGEQRLVQRLEAKVDAALATLHIDQFDLETPWATLAAKGEAHLNPTGAVDLVLQWVVPVEGLSKPVAGQGKLSGTLKKLFFDLHNQQPAAVDISGDIQPLEATLPWTARVDAPGLNPNEILAGLPAFGAWHAHIDAKGNMNGAEIGTLSLEQALDRAHEQVSRKIVGEGRIDWGDKLVIDARLHGERLAWPLAGAPQIEVPQINLALQGSLSDYTLKGAADLQVPHQPKATITLQGKGDLARMDIAALKVKALDGELLATGGVAWSPGLSWQADLEARNVHPEVLLPAWPGSLNAKASMQGKIKDGKPTARLDIERLHGTLRGYPLEAAMHGELAGETLDLQHFDLRSGKSHVTAQGQLGERLAVSAKLVSPNLAELLPGAGGALQGEARIEGKPTAPRLLASFDGQQLRWKTASIDAASLKAEGALSEEAPLQLTLEARTIRSEGSQVLESVNVQIDGTTRAHTLRVDASQGKRGAELRFEGTGSWDGSVEHMTLKEAYASKTPLGDWRSLAPVELTAGADRLDLPRWCWGQNEARLCLAANRNTGQGMSVDIDLSRFDLASLDPLLGSKPLRLRGLLAGSARLHAPAIGDMTVSASLQGEQTVLRVPGNKRGEWLDMPLETAHLNSKLGAGLSHFDASLRMNASNRIEAALRLPGHRLEDGAPKGQRLDGEAQVHFNDPRMLAGLIPALKEPRGVLAGRVIIAGTLGQPRLFGGAQLSEASAVLPDLGIRVEDARLQLDAGPDHHLTLMGDARLGEGRLSIDGGAHLARLPDWRATLRLKGENLTALRLPEASMQASPDLRIELAPGKTRLEGRVEIPKASFDISGGGPSAARVSDDVRILGDAQKHQRAQALHTRLEVVLGDDVRVRGLGFEGRIAGQLAVIDSPELPTPIGQGELTIPEGRYKAYGQDLLIQQGRILFADTPLDDPAIDLRAVRRVTQDEVVAGVRVTGRASRPDVRIFSEPAMEQAEVLAYLITGKSLKKGSSNEASLMIQAIRAAGFAGGDLLAGQIGSAFGLEEAAIETDAGTKEISLVLGRYLTPRLYLRYVQGLEAGLQTFILRYELTRHIDVQLQSGEKAGVDVFYGFER